MDDFMRPLNERGERNAPRMAKRLKEKKIVLDLLLSSPAVRAIQTAHLFAKVLEVRPSILQTETALYHASSETLLSVIRQIKNSADTVMLVGHNPGLTDFANALLQEHIINIPTCGIVSCALTIQRWEDTQFGIGKKLFYDYPKNPAS